MDASRKDTRGNKQWKNRREDILDCKISSEKVYGLRQSEIQSLLETKGGLKELVL